jgi:hypothetical protein
MPALPVSRHTFRSVARLRDMVRRVFGDTPVGVANWCRTLTQVSAETRAGSSVRPGYRRQDVSPPGEGVSESRGERRGSACLAVWRAACLATLRRGKPCTLF